MNSKKQIITVKLIFIAVLIVLLINGCSKSTEPQKPKKRWKRVEAFGDTQMTGLYLNSDKTKLSVTTINNFGLIPIGEVEPTVVNPLEVSIDGNYLEYIPYFCDDYYFYCDKDGQIMYVGDNKNGNFLGEIPITSIVDSFNLPAMYIESRNMYQSNHIETDNKGLYMISIRQNDPITENPQDDRLYFGSFDYDNNSIHFNIEKSIKSYKEPSSYAVTIRSNYYYGGYFWQYRNESFCPPQTVVDKNYNVQYITFYPFIRYVFAYKDYTIGVFSGILKKSFDGGFTWEDWLSLNAGWDFVEIAGKNVAFYSISIASLDFETLEIENYDIGELAEGHCIIAMTEFGDKVFAATLGGLFYCDIDDFFVPKAKKNKKKKDELNLKILKNKKERK